jgi:hypothetical protein
MDLLCQLIEYWSFLPDFALDADILNLIIDFVLNRENRNPGENRDY